jgi:SHS family lactate transporter-like MFS transporter
VDRHLPALAVLYIRRYVQEPEVWVENRRRQREQQKEFRAPLLDIFRLRVLGNTITACLWMGSSFIVYYSVSVRHAPPKDLHVDPAMVALPIALANAVAFLASGSWGWVADRAGRRWSMIIPAVVGIFITPLYVFVGSYAVITHAFVVQGAFLGAIYGQNASYLSESFPTEVRATAAGFCYHQSAIWGGLVAPVMAALAAVSRPGSRCRCWPARWAPR